MKFTQPCSIGQRKDGNLEHDIDGDNANEETMES